MGWSGDGRNTKNPPGWKTNPFDKVICFHCTVEFVYLGLCRATRPKT